MDDKYTPIHNEVLEALFKVDISPSEWRILLVVFRYTFGFEDKKGGRLKVNNLSLNFISTATGLDRRNVARSLKKLLSKKLIFRDESTTGFSREFMKLVSISPLGSVNSTTRVVSPSPLGVVSISPPNKEIRINKTLKKEDTNVSSWGDPLINKGIDLLKELNGNTSRIQLSRFALKRLYAKHGEEKVLKVFKWAMSLRGQPYAPVVTNFLDLEQKWSSLEAYAVRSKGERSRHAIDASEV